MSETKHTPGPWESARSSEISITVRRAVNGESVCSLGITHKATAANARLIAAAPDLLAACKDLFADPHSTTAAKHAREAIAKAEGSAQ